jgi:1,4-alpha-glucan branching enzyme
MEKIETTFNIEPKHFTDYDIFLFKSGRHFKLYEKFGSRIKTIDGVSGTYFSVWAPAAKKISVIGDFNGWDPCSAPMSVRWDNSGIWEIFIPDVGEGALYKFHITAANSKLSVDKSDPFAYFSEPSPRTASIVHSINGYCWNDGSWMEKRHFKNSLSSPISIYELHLGSWKSQADCNPGMVQASGEFQTSKRFATYREIAPCLVEYIKKMGYTHVELMPIMEHPFYGSWGYQVTGYFASTSRYGEPQDLQYLIDLLHQNNIGVFLDWVPSHFPDDAHGLGNFDGTCLYEHKDPRKGFHPDWKSLIFNYGRNEVKEFLISSAMFWIDKYHADGLRIDGVASMLYLDYSRKKGEWIPNKYGGRENLEALDFIKDLNEALYGSFPDIQIIAEESTAWPAVTKPKYSGGLGFGMKWNMGWMHDTLNYFSKDPVYRKYHQNDLTFAFWYAFFENFLLPLSHDEVVYGKRSLLEKMPGDSWQQFANLRLLLGYMYSFPGKKLLFMGSEFAQRKEWDHESFLEWSELKHEPHLGIQHLVADLNKIYSNEAALYASDFQPENFEWIDSSDTRQSIILFLRKTWIDGNNESAGGGNASSDDNRKNPGGKVESIIVIACNFTPAPRYKYQVGVPHDGEWIEIFNSDAQAYGGSGHGNYGKINASKKSTHGRPYTISVTLPPLAILYFKKDIFY